MPREEIIYNSKSTTDSVPKKYALLSAKEDESDISNSDSEECRKDNEP